MSSEFSFSKILRILLIILRLPIFGDETSFSSSDQHFRHIEAVKPQVSDIFGKGFYHTIWWVNFKNILKFILLS